MGLFSKKSKNKNWDILKKQSYKDSAKNRDVHSTQNLERGEIGEVDKPYKERVGAVFIALIFGALAFGVGYIFSLIASFFSYIASNEGASFLDYSIRDVNVTVDWKLYAWTGFVFLLAWLIANERLMMTWRARNSMADTTDINTYENDQHIMLFEEMQEAYDWFPDTGAHSDVQVSSMLSHMMLDNKGLKRIDVVERHKKDVKDEDGRILFYKGEPVLDEDGNPVKRKMSLIDTKFGQELFTASGIPTSEKDIRQPIDVRKIPYNPKDDSGSRKDRDKLGYDTVADLINNDWEFPDYEVQRPAGAYLVDTAPVNTMVLAITRAGKGKLARFV